MCICKTVYSQAVITLLDCCVNLPSTHAKAGMITWELKGTLWPRQLMANCVKYVKSSSHLLINLQGVGAQEMQCSSNTGLITGAGWHCGRQWGIPCMGPLCWRAAASPGGVLASGLCCMKDASLCLGWHLLLEKPHLGDSICEYRKLENIFGFTKNQHGIN